jgi:hypothetical protein
LPAKGEKAKRKYQASGFLANDRIFLARFIKKQEKLIVHELIFSNPFRPFAFFPFRPLNYPWQRWRTLSPSTMYTTCSAILVA